MANSECHPIFLWQHLAVLRKALRCYNPKFAGTTDRALASVGYPARALGYYISTLSPNGASQLESLAATISDFRTFKRLVETPATIEWALDILMEPVSKDPIERQLLYVRAISGVIYQVLENLSYLGSKGILRMSARREADFSVWSTWAWDFDILAAILIQIENWRLNRPVNYRSLFVNLAWAPLAWHWSTYDGRVHKGIVGLFGTYTNWAQLPMQWAQA